MMKIIVYPLIFALLPLWMASQDKERIDLIKNIHYHLFLSDNQTAYEKAKKAYKNYQNHKDVQKAYIKTLLSCEKEMQALDLFQQHFVKENCLEEDKEFLEEISWKIIQRGTQSSQYFIRLTALVAAFLTQDSRAVNVIRKMMCDHNAIIRMIAIQFACQYRDYLLQQEIIERLEQENVWLVRLELIQAIGKMKIVHKSDYLKTIVMEDKNTYEEKTKALQSLIELYEDISLNELKEMASSPKAGLRQLTCHIATNLKIIEAKEIIFSLLQDAHKDVRISAYNSIALFYRDYLSDKKLESIISQGIKDNDPLVSITASWLALLANSSQKDAIKQWLEDDDKELRRIAAAAVAIGGEQAQNIAKDFMEKSRDDFVKANLAFGLLGQRKMIKECKQVLFSFFSKKEMLWMWDSARNPVFKMLCPSRVRHNDQMPQYPETMDLFAQLHLLSVLTIFEKEKTKDLLQTFLAKKNWGISAIAAATLLKEGAIESMDYVYNFLQHPDPSIRVQAALVLAMFAKEEKAIHTLEEAFFACDKAKKSIILEAMANIATLKSLSFLSQVFKESSQSLRIMGASVMIRAVNH